MVYELGDVIAIRELSFVTQAEERPVFIRLGKPQQFPNSEDCYAPFQITGIGSETVLCAGGIDAFQAIQEVMKVIAAQLIALEKDSRGRLSWKGDDRGVGFPIA